MVAVTTTSAPLTTSSARPRHRRRVFGERGRPTRAPHPDLSEVAHQRQSLEVATRLHPRTYNRQH